jgi:hypothetical protein
MAAAVEQLGAFGTRPATNNAATRAAILKIKQLTLKALRSESQLADRAPAPPLLEQLSIVEVNCPDEGCVDLETAIMILGGNQREGIDDVPMTFTGATPAASPPTGRTVRVRKPLLDVLESDIKDAFLEFRDGVDGGASDLASSGPCSCCESNLQKQQDGCSCCGFRMPQVEVVADPLQGPVEGRRHHGTETSNGEDNEVGNSAALMVSPVVKSLQVEGKSWLPVLPADTATVGTLKHAVSREGGPASENQRLLFKGRELCNDQALLVADVGMAASSSGKASVASQQVYLLRKQAAIEAGT